MTASVFEIMGAGRDPVLRGLGSPTRLAVVFRRAGSVGGYISKQPVAPRMRFNRALVRSASVARIAMLERRLLAVSHSRTLAPRSLRGPYGLGGFRGLGGTPREDLEEALALASQAEADSIAAAALVGEIDLEELANQAAYKAWGETTARLGLPISYGSFLKNAAYQAVRGSRTYIDVLPGTIGDWISRADSLGGITNIAGGWLSNAEFMVNRRLGGNLDQVVGMGRNFRERLDATSTSIVDMASGFAESVEAGALSLSQDAMALRPAWMSDELVGQVGRSIQGAIAAGSSGELTKIFTAIGGGLMAVGAVTGPAAPFVMAAGGLMMLGSLIADVFMGSSAPEPPRPARIASEHWGAFKLLYSASVERQATASIEYLAIEEFRKVFGDPNTGETMIRPNPDWTGPGGMRSSRDWPHAMRMVDMFDRRALLNDRVAQWKETGRGIMFDGAENTPCSLYKEVLVTDPFVKFAGAMASSPAPYPTGGGTVGIGSWPVGPVNRGEESFWTSPTYRAAYIASVALGGTPPFASYGLYHDNYSVRDYWKSSDWAGGAVPGTSYTRTIGMDRAVPYCTGVGGRWDPSTLEQSARRWIPWASVYVPGHPLRLIPPRRVPDHLKSVDYNASTSAAIDEFRQWLFNGTVVLANVNRDMDPELTGTTVGGPGEPTIIRGDADARRMGMVGNPLDRAMTLESFFSRTSGDTGWFDRVYDENEPRTWFTKGTPASVGSSISARGPIVPLVRAQAQEREQRKREEAEKWSATKKVAVGAAVVGVPTGLYFLGRALRWWK